MSDLSQLLEASEDALRSRALFNPLKNDYEATPLLMGSQQPGLFDSINKRFPEVWKIYKNMKSLDWDENEFPFTSCKLEFATCSPNYYQAMIRTLAWQWEADSMACRAVAPIMACFNPCSELWAAYSAINTNEILHALTYSEIVRSSFDNPNTVLKEIIEVQEAFRRMETISRVMHQGYTTAHRFALGLVGNTQETYNDMYLFLAAMYLLERCQFPSSFAVTFIIASTSTFIPIGKAVQKIAQDELEVHAPLGALVLQHERSTPRGKVAYEQTKSIVQQMFSDVVAGELNWNAALLSEGRELPGITNQLLDGWTLFNAADALHPLGITNPMPIEMPKRNPLKFMEDWIDISKTQASPQEQQNGQYKLNVLERDDDGEIFQF